MAFDVKVREELFQAKEAVNRAYIAYEECQGLTDLDPESGDLARAILEAERAKVAINTFLKRIKGKEKVS